MTTDDLLDVSDANLAMTFRSGVTDLEDDDYLGAQAESAALGMRVAWKEVVTNTRRTLANQEEKPLRLLRRSAEDAAKKLDAAAARADKALAAIRRERDALQRKAAFKSPEPMEAFEVRTVLRNLPKDERSDFVRAAINDGDARTLGAIFTSSPSLTGVPVAVWEPLQEDARRKLFGPELKRIAQLEKAERELAASGSRLAFMASRLIDFEAAKAEPTDIRAAAIAEAAVRAERERLTADVPKPMLPSKAERKRQGRA